MRMLLSALLAGALLAGCGSSGKTTPAELIPVEGTVKLGGAPTSDILVNLTPYGNTKGQGAWGKTDAAGAFKLLHLSNKEGVEPGEYVISFSYLVKTDGTPLPPNTSPTEVPSVQGISSPWSESTSEAFSQRVNVKKEGMSPLSFDVPPSKFVKKS